MLSFGWHGHLARALVDALSVRVPPAGALGGLRRFGSGETCRSGKPGKQGRPGWAPPTVAGVPPGRRGCQTLGAKGLLKRNAIASPCAASLVDLSVRLDSNGRLCRLIPGGATAVAVCPTRLRSPSWPTVTTFGTCRNWPHDRGAGTTMIYPHVLNRGGRAVRSPADLTRRRSDAC